MPRNIVRAQSPSFSRVKEGDLLRFSRLKTSKDLPLLRFSILTCMPPVRTPGVLVENTSSVSPACRKRRLKGRRYIAIVADTA